jgi:hypothetical protein
MYFLNVKFIALTTECESDILKLPTDYTSRTVLVFSAGYNYIYIYIYMCVCVCVCVCVLQSIPKIPKLFQHERLQL